MARFKKISEIAKNKKCPYTHRQLREIVRYRHVNGINHMFKPYISGALYADSSLLIPWLEQREKEIDRGYLHTWQTPLFFASLTNKQKEHLKLTWYDKLIYKLFDSFKKQV